MASVATSANALFPSNFLEIRNLTFIELVQRMGLVSAYAFALLFGFFVIRSIYNIWFHPLAKFPGPWYAKTTFLVEYFYNIAGNREAWMVENHKKYGEVVRYTPNNLSFTSAQAWKDIHGHRVGGKKSFVKDRWMYGHNAAMNGGFRSMIEEPNDEKHSRVRKIFTNAFSDRALREQEPLLLKYVDMLVARIHSTNEANPGKPMNIVRLYNYTTFDIMAELTFGESLNMLAGGEYSPWVVKFFAFVKYATFVSIIGRYEWLRKLFIAILPESAHIARNEHMGYVTERVDRRMDMVTDKPDIWNLILRKPENMEILNDRREMYENASLFMGAGTETTATMLSGLTYYLLKHPAKMQRVVDEVRALKEDELHIDNLRALPYLQGCFEEGLRIFPPVPSFMSRQVPEGGAPVAGHFIPDGTTVSMHQLSTYRNEANFKNAYSFVPERWLADRPEEYVNDRREALQPFSTGPRNCMGKNLAYHEMRMIFAKVVWNFDLALDPSSENWPDQKTYALWEKHPLMVTLTPRQK